MTEQRVHRIIPFLTLVFVFALVADGLAVTPGSSLEDIQASIVRGEALMAAGEYAAAMDVYVRVLPRIKEKGTKTDIYFNLARAAHLMNDVSRAEDYLRELFELDRTRRISGGKYTKTFYNLFEKVKAEYWFSIRADDDYRDVAEKQVIANLSRKPKKKKIPTLLIVAASVVVAAAVVALLILPGGEQETPEEATLIIENRTNWVLYVGIGPTGARRSVLKTGLSRVSANRIDPWQDVRYTLAPGTYRISISNHEKTIYLTKLIAAASSLTITVDPSLFDD